MGRWIRIDTAVFEHAVFALEQFSEREAWLWMIASAAWKDTKHRVGSTIVPVPTGSFYSTVREMQAAWRWKSTTRVVAYLRRLEKEDMINHETSTGKTQITICNYTRFQHSEDTEKTKKIHGEDSENTQKTPLYQDTNKSSLRSDVCDAPEIKIEAVIELQATNNETVTISKAELTEWVEAFPAVDVMQQLRSMRQWLNANQKNRKTAGGMRRFVVSWLSKEQDKAPSSHRGQSPPPRRTPFQQHQQDGKDAFDRKLGIKRDDEFARDTIDLESADWRAH